MSALPKYLLSLVILLLAGYGQLSAHTPSSSNDIHRSDEVCSVNSNETSFISPISHKEQQKHTLSVLIESEGENELISFKKRLESNHYPVDICFGQTTPRDYFRYDKNTSLMPYLSGDRYLLNQVFRI